MLLSEKGLIYRNIDFGFPRDCKVIANKMAGETKESGTQLNFRCGVNMGIGSFNLVSMC